MDEKKSEQNGASQYESFKDLTRRLVSVPKKEVDNKEAAYQRKKARKKRRSAS